MSDVVTDLQRFTLPAKAERPKFSSAAGFGKNKLRPGSVRPIRTFAVSKVRLHGILAA
jgi:hypothetical protein